MDILERFGLRRYAQTPARNLPYGEQRRLEIARALISRPRLLLLDEPAAGMNQAETAALVELLQDLRQEFKLTILLIEHHMGVVLDLCERVQVLDFGATIFSGSPQEARAGFAGPGSISWKRWGRGIITARSCELIQEGRRRARLSLFSSRLYMLLQIDDLWVSYDHIQAVRGVTLNVAPGEIVTLIGANGAGKSSILRAISGLQPVAKGAIRFDGHNLRQWPAHAIAQQGIAHVPEGRGIFGTLTVLENLRLAAYGRRDKELAGDLDRVFTLFPRLAERRLQWGSTLSGGEQQMLAVGRALMRRGPASAAG